jgi:hypothetical protein
LWLASSLYSIILFTHIMRVLSIMLWSHKRAR